ncbi:hypothetical protein GCM10010168_74500 [Actinoplanes ianthinogenes]|uniref:Uncharacterized protein n=2 Tax=Actinoplanes ianthinogenes TaxID=122358 RepID=A0ABM7LR45_9ACTN|nr:hypothetical protein Aiant_24190 [Actinoplanes ianthinogenes]GGR44767.1 hypothetical protein GCM10010168_74500 [Actinoplanes ianthinogenes]
MSEWLLGGPGFAANRELDADDIPRLARLGQRLPLPDHPVWALPGDRPTRWYTVGGVVLREDAGTWVWARSDSEDAIAELRRSLPGDWQEWDEG